MPTADASRRRFLISSLLAAGAALIARPVLSARGFNNANRREHHGPVHTIYRLSLRGRRGSRAAKLHNANMRFTTPHIADQNRAHPGDNSRIVPLTVSREEYFRLFVPQRGLRQRFTPVADLRKL